MKRYGATKTARRPDAALETLNVSESESTHDMHLSGLSDMNGSWGTGSVDPAWSLMLPTLDVVVDPPPAVTPSVATPLSGLEFHNEWSQLDAGSSLPGFGSDGSAETQMFSR